MGDLKVYRAVKPDGSVINDDLQLLLAPTNSVPAVAARQRGQVLFRMNWLKGCVGCFFIYAKMSLTERVSGRSNGKLEFCRSWGNFMSRSIKQWKHKGTPLEEVAWLCKIDAETRRCGDQIGFETLVVRAVNDDYQVRRLVLLNLCESVK